jgi:Pyruvate/2-oxoacid:ferredoxin oxidoreductase gamma subunit
MTDIAAKLGTTRSANMIAVGALVRHSKTLSLRNIVNALREVFKDKEDLFIMNKKALERGYGS